MFETIITNLTYLGPERLLALTAYPFTLPRVGSWSRRVKESQQSSAERQSMKKVSDILVVVLIGCGPPA